MFKFLILISIVFLALGFYLEKENFGVKEEKIVPNNDKLADIESRINEIEEILYSFDNKVNETKVDQGDIYVMEDFKSTIENTSDSEGLIDNGALADNINNKSKIINSYANGEINLAEACDMLGMNKGEVLLLRNLYIESKN